MAGDWLEEVKRKAMPRLRAGVRLVLRPARRLPWVDRSLRSTLDYLIECRVVRRHLSDAHDGALPRWRLALVRAHVASCEACGKVDASLRGTIDLLRDLKEP